MSAAALRLQAFHAHVRALNDLVAAVERLKVEAPSFPCWSRKPKSFEGQKLKPTETRALGVEWEAFASEYRKAFEDASLDELLDTDGLVAIANRAREALIALSAYDGAYPEKL